MNASASALSQTTCSEDISSSSQADALNKESELIGDRDAGEKLFESGCGPSFIQSGGEEAVEVCRVCQCAEPDKSGEAALKILGISFLSHAGCQNTTNGHVQGFAGDNPGAMNDKFETETTQNGQSSIEACQNDSEAAPCISSVDTLMALGCACRSDLALAHYACALRWFVSRGSMICEICGAPAVNVNIADRNKVISVLKERDSLQARNSAVGSGESSSIDFATDHSVAAATLVSREELLELTSWFDPQGNAVLSLPRNTSEQVIDIPEEGLLNSVSPATKWAVEGAGILIATGLLTVTITWLLAPRVVKGVPRKGLNVLLGGLCAFSIVVFLRFGVLPRIKYGPARYWAILVVFWFLVFGVWASSTRSTHSNP